MIAIGSALCIPSLALNPPSLRCVSIQPSGDVVLNWVPPPDPLGVFNSYHIFFSTAAGGPFICIDSLFTYSPGTYTHAGANACNQNVYYFILTREGCCSNYSTPSDTLRAIRFLLNNTGNGLANLSWNASHQPLLPTSSTWYHVYKEYPAGSWTLIDSTPSLSYVDTITVCDDFISYRIEITDASGCTSVSCVEGDQFQDVTAPSVPVIDTVSVNPLTEIPIITWNVNPNGDTQGYIIYLWNGIAWSLVGATSGIANNSFINGLSDAANNSELYAVAAVDSCGNLSPISVGHNTIHIDAVIDACEETVTLSWNSYINLQAGVSHYEIFASENSGAFISIGTTSFNTFTHSALNNLSTYCYYVRMNGNITSQTAASDSVCVYADLITPPLFTYLKKVSVQPDNSVYAECFVDTSADVSRYRLERSLSFSGPYEEVITISTSGNVIESFTDFSGLAGQSSVYYRVVNVSDCNEDLTASNIAKTIFLTAQAQVNLSNMLSWNDYEGWATGTSHFNIYRQIPGQMFYSYLATIPNTQFTYTDDVQIFLTGDGSFCYYVEAAEAAGNPFGFSDSSTSNITCAYQQPHVFIPNAFTPEGSNPVFLPVTVFANKSRYSFYIFSREGQIIFETNDPQKGWDGTFENEKVPQGVYVYYVNFYGSDGTQVKKRGAVTLLR